MSESEPQGASLRTRVIVFAVIALACVLGGGAFVAVAALSGDGTTADTRVATVRMGANMPAEVRGRRVLVRAADSSDPGLAGRVSVVRLGSGRPRTTDLSCQRVYMAGGRGICLTLGVAAIDYSAVVFDRNFQEVHTLGIDGIPSRARVSPDGRLGSVTSFVTGHSYAEAGRFSTSTRLLDLRRGRWLGNLEDFEVVKSGQRLESPDFNFWGVTFERDGDGFYATLSTGEHRYLVHGSVRERRVEVLRDRVECPSLSPDGRRIAYKRTLGGGRWRLHVLHLQTGADRALSEPRSIDDQVEWLNDSFVLYGDERGVQVTPADGSGRPRAVLTGAASPATLG